MSVATVARASFEEFVRKMLNERAYIVYSGDVKKLLKLLLAVEPTVKKRALRRFEEMEPLECHCTYIRAKMKQDRRPEVRHAQVGFIEDIAFHLGGDVYLQQLLLVMIEVAHHALSAVPTLPERTPWLRRAPDSEPVPA
ncbi:MAG: hypothetical protein PHS79_02560 [Patescibacteria group bacterium]|nr:hypothetical protein [Patescibacteria group bacterium]